MSKRIVYIAIPLSLTLMASALMAGVCWYAADYTMPDMPANCTQNGDCYSVTYSPPLMHCSWTCDTLVCNYMGPTTTTQTVKQGECYDNECVNISTTENPKYNTSSYVSDDGCTTPCDS